MKSHGFMNTSEPQLTVPQVSETESGPASSTLSRASNGSVTAPPVESCTMRSVASRTAVTVSESWARSRVGRAAPSRMWMWMSAAPAASQAVAAATSSSRVAGSAGASDLAVSAPVGATVIMVGVDTPPIVARVRHWSAPGTQSGADSVRWVKERLLWTPVTDEEVRSD